MDGVVWLTERVVVFCATRGIKALLLFDRPTRSRLCHLMMCGAAFFQEKLLYLCGSSWGGMRHYLTDVAREQAFKGVFLTSNCERDGKEEGDGDNADKETHVVYYIHGGGFHTGHPLQQLLWLCSLRWRLRRYYQRHVAVFCLDYTLSGKKAAYPTQMSEVAAGYDWLGAMFDPRHIIIMGDSAGGNAALSLCHSIMNRSRRYHEGREGKGEVAQATASAFASIPGSLLPAGCVAISPWLDLRCEAESYQRNKWCDLLDPELARYWAEQYVGEAGSTYEVGVSPGLESPDKLENLPIYVYGSKDECMADDFYAYRDRCRKERRMGCTIVDLREGEVHDHGAQMYITGLRSIADGIDRIACVTNFMFGLNLQEKMSGNMVNIGDADLDTTERILLALGKQD